MDPVSGQKLPPDGEIPAYPVWPALLGLRPLAPLPQLSTFSLAKRDVLDLSNGGHQGEQEL